MGRISQFKEGKRREPLSGRRRNTPNEWTGREAEYVDWLSKNRIPVIIKLVDQEEVHGWIEYYDREIVRLTRSREPNLFIYKDQIKYLYEDPANGRRRRHPDHT